MKQHFIVFETKLLLEAMLGNPKPLLRRVTKQNKDLRWNKDKRTLTNKGYDVLGTKEARELIGVHFCWDPKKCLPINSNNEPVATMEDIPLRQGHTVSIPSRELEIAAVSV